MKDSVSSLESIIPIMSSASQNRRSMTREHAQKCWKQCLSLTRPSFGLFFQKEERRLGVSSQTEIHAYTLLSLTSAISADCSKESIRGCTAEVKILDGDTATCSWREVWAAAVAVNEKCVKKSKAGIAFDLGKSPFLSLTLALSR